MKEGIGSVWFGGERPARLTLIDQPPRHLERRSREEQIIRLLIEAGVGHEIWDSCRLTHRETGGSGGLTGVELYDLDEDAGETWSRHSVDADAVEALSAALREQLTRSETLRSRLLPDRPELSVELSEAERADLRALGYVDGENAESSR